MSRQGKIMAILGVPVVLALVFWLYKSTTPVEPVVSEPPPPRSLTVAEVRRLFAERTVVEEATSEGPALTDAGYVSFRLRLNSHGSDLLREIDPGGVDGLAVNLAMEDGRGLDPISLDMNGGDIVATSRPVAINAAGTAGATFGLQTASGQALEDLLRVEIRLQGPAKLVKIRDAAGNPALEIEIKANGLPLRLAGISSIGEALAGPWFPGEGTMTDVLKQVENQAVTLISAPDDQLPPACDALASALSGGLGMADADIKDLQGLLERVRYLFAGGDVSCTGRMPEPAPAVAAERVAAQNAVMAEVAGIMRWGGNPAALENLAGRFADGAVVVDGSGLFLDGEGDVGVWQGDAAAVVPAATPAVAAEIMSFLPAERVACYSRGDGVLGAGRRALVQLRQDSGLMVLDLTFDARDKIAGIRLMPATQEAFCRAAAGRMQGEDACFFAATGRTYRGIDPGKC